ncbi:MAG: hypothetical protein VSS75_002920 [Candidatus Parabeggiatoa sp.]|nr:hypothetical protein [Candidatus Parabeggiatoa sp.]
MVQYLLDNHVFYKDARPWRRTAVKRRTALETHGSKETHGSASLRFILA